VVDSVTRMLAKAPNAILIIGLCSDVWPGGVICLQYADDTILFADNDVNIATNLKHVLTFFK
jgi:hypothetical protein